MRSRRISTASTATRRGMKRDDNVVEQDIIVPNEVRGRASFTSTSTSPANTINQRFSSSKSNHSLRANRTRTNSTTSSGSNQRLGSSIHLCPASSLLPSNSQVALEKVIGSRLVETFVVISIPSKNQSSENASQPIPASKLKPSRSAPPSRTAFTPVEKYQKHSREASGADIRTNGRLPPHSAHPSNTTFKSTSRTDPGKTTSARQIAKSPPLNKGKVVGVSVEEGPSRRPSPIYFSPVHKPSTNPYFGIDARAGHDFPSGCDDVGQFMKIEIWGKTSYPRNATQRKLNNEDHDWRLLDEWDVDLDKLVPLSDDVRFSPFSQTSCVHKRFSLTLIFPQMPLFLLYSRLSGDFISRLRGLPQ